MSGSNEAYLASINKSHRLGNISKQKEKINVTK